MKMEDLLFKLALHQNGSIKFGYAHKSLWHSYVAISPGYKISASLTKIPTAVGNACPRQRWPRQSWLGVSKKSHQKKIEVLTQPYTLSCWHWLGIGWPTHPDLPRTILILKPKLPCLGILLSRRQIGTFGHPDGRWCIKGLSCFPQMIIFTFKAKLFFFIVKISKNSKSPPFSLLLSQSRELFLSNITSINFLFIIATNLDFIPWSWAIVKLPWSLPALTALCMPFSD